MKKVGVLVAVLTLTLFTGCASINPVETPNSYQPEINRTELDERIDYVEDYRPEPAGFWKGVWHGFVSPISLLAIAFGNEDIGVYETYNTGNWYNFGFLLGAGALAGGGSSTYKD